VVSVFFSNSTTETPRTTEFAQRNAFPDRLRSGRQKNHYAKVYEADERMLI